MSSQAPEATIQQAPNTATNEPTQPKDRSGDVGKVKESSQIASEDGQELVNQNGALEVTPEDASKSAGDSIAQSGEQEGQVSVPQLLTTSNGQDKSEQTEKLDVKGKSPATNHVGDLDDAPPPVPAKDATPVDATSEGAITPALEKLQELRINSNPSSDTEDAEKASINERQGQAEEGGDVESRSEIASIMDQFQDGMGGPDEQEIMSPRLELAGPLLGSPVSHPPRKSSLEPLQQASNRDSFPPALSSPPPRSSSLQGPPAPSNASITSVQTQERTSSPRPSSQIYKPPPPDPDPEPDLPFDFHRFLEQLRHRTADPVAKFLRSFLLEFGKKSWAVHEQVKIISDFLAFISKKMAQCEVWRTVSDAEFDNAREGMEKLVMNRLYSQTFSPAIPPPEVVRKGRREELVGGRRGQHQEDVERDEVLAQKVRIYGWVKEEHLDIKPVGDKGRKFMKLAQQELLKIKSYRAPRDKVICILNCCKVIFGFLRDSKADQSADAFVPLLIYVVLHANPEHLVSNVQYILRFRNQDKLGGEAGYYISSLMGAVQFIENLDRTSLTITDEEFEKNVEAAVSAIAERHTAEEEAAEAERQRQSLLQSPSRDHRRAVSPNIQISEKSTLSRPEVTPRNSLEAERSTPRRTASARESKESEREGEEGVAGLLRTIQRPLSSIGRIFSDDTPQPPQNSPPKQPYPGQHQRLLNAQPVTPQRLATDPQNPRRSEDDPRRAAVQQQQIQRIQADNAAAVQASVESEQVRQAQRQEFEVVVDTLAGMFPGLDREIIGDVVRGKEGNIGSAVDACLALTG